MTIPLILFSIAVILLAIEAFTDRVKHPQAFVMLIIVLLATAAITALRAADQMEML